MGDMFIKEVLDIEPRMIEWRRYLHQNPEVSFEEYNTTEFIVNKLNEFGNISISRPTKTGCVGSIFGTKGGTAKVLGIRADIDALPMPEKNDLPYRSTMENVMHACGHDGHTAILLGLAEYLSSHRDEFAGEVRLIFQHAEEAPPGGAIEMLRAGVVDGVDMMLSLHLSSNWDTGIFGVHYGVLTAAVDRFDVTVKGKGGHCAFPEQTVDPIVAASHIVLALQNIVSRKTGATDPAVLSICRINGGTAYNIIPDTVTITGAVRSFSPDTRRLIHDEVHHICHCTAEASHATCDVSYDLGYPSVENDDTLTAICENLLLSRFGGNYVERIGCIMPGEDYAYFLDGRPGFFVELGTRNSAKQCDMPHHNSAYRMDEDALRFGLQYFIDAVHQLLNGGNA